MVPFGVPPFTEVVRLNESNPGGTLANVKLKVPDREPPAAAASSETYASSGARVTFAHAKAASPVPEFVTFTRNTGWSPGCGLESETEAAKERLGWEKTYTREVRTGPPRPQHTPARGRPPPPPRLAASVPRCPHL